MRIFKVQLQQLAESAAEDPPGASYAGSGLQHLKKQDFEGLEECCIVRMGVWPTDPTWKG